MNFSAAKQLPPALSSRFGFSGPYGVAMMLTLCAAAALLALGAQAQTAPPAVAPGASAPPAAQTGTAASAPKYSAKDLEQAFGFMDGNKDGKVSRDEAASFRNVAKYFDEADTDKDQTLSPEEFETAMNRSKSKAP